MADERTLPHKLLAVELRDDEICDFVSCDPRKPGLGLDLCEHVQITGGRPVGKWCRTQDRPIEVGCCQQNPTLSITARCSREKLSKANEARRAAENFQ